MVSPKRPAPHDTHLLLNPSHVAEEPAGGVARLVAAHTCRDILGESAVRDEIGFRRLIVERFAGEGKGPKLEPQSLKPHHHITFYFELLVSERHHRIDPHGPTRR